MSDVDCSTSATKAIYLRRHGMLIATLGIVTIIRMPTDIFPEIEIPVVAAIWNYVGLSPDEMETRVVGNFERVPCLDGQ